MLAMNEKSRLMKRESQGCPKVSSLCNWLNDDAILLR